MPPMGTFSYVYGTIWGRVSPTNLSLGTASKFGVGFGIWGAGGVDPPYGILFLRLNLEVIVASTQLLIIY